MAYWIGDTLFEDRSVLGLSISKLLSVSKYQETKFMSAKEITNRMTISLLH